MSNAYLFLTKDEIHPNYTKLINTGDHNNLYIHPKHPDKINGVFKPFIIDGLVDTVWGDISIVQATLQLLRTAFKEETNKWFILLSGDDSYQIPDNIHLGAEGGQQQLSLFHFLYKNGNYYKTSQWWILTRTDVAIILEKSGASSTALSNKYPKDGAVDEYYFLSLLYANNPDYLYVNRQIMYDRWLKYTTQKHPFYFNRLLKNDASAIDKAGSLFIRKVSPTFTYQIYTPSSSKKRLLYVIYIGTETDQDALFYGGGGVEGAEGAEEGGVDARAEREYKDTFDIIVITAIPQNEIKSEIAERAIYIIPILYKLFYETVLDICNTPDIVSQWNTVIFTTEKYTIRKSNIIKAIASGEDKKELPVEKSKLSFKNSIENKDIKYSYITDDEGQLAFMFGGGGAGGADEIGGVVVGDENNKNNTGVVGAINLRRRPEPVKKKQYEFVVPITVAEDTDLNLKEIEEKIYKEIGVYPIDVGVAVAKPVQPEPPAIIAPPAPEPAEQQQAPVQKKAKKVGEVVGEAIGEVGEEGEGDIIEIPPKTSPFDKSLIGEAVAVAVSKKAQQPPPIITQASTYYMNNRKQFITKWNEWLKRLETEYNQKHITDSDITCEKMAQTENMELFLHQKIVSDYLNLYTPYRGLLLYHGLGSGKTCSSIAIAEGMKHKKKIFLLTPASLKTNYIKEIKKCGDPLYRKNSYWEWVSVEGHPERIPEFAKKYNLPKKEIQEKGGVWEINATHKKSNFSGLSGEQQKQIDQQLDKMIYAKYETIHYNGLNENIMYNLVHRGRPDKDGNKTAVNPFHNSVVVVDEAHNLVSRILGAVNKKKTTNISYRLYDYLMDAQDARIVLLTGTPIINYTYETSVLFNILRGYIYTWEINVEQQNINKTKINRDYIVQLFKKNQLTTFDYVEYTLDPTNEKKNIVRITRNPFGFVNVNDDKTGMYKGVSLNTQGNLINKHFIEQVQTILQENGIKIANKKTDVRVIKNTCLPDDREQFLKLFINAENVQNMSLYKTRILGLTSYFRSAQEKLMPRIITDPTTNEAFHRVLIDMSPEQLIEYNEVRVVEIEEEEKMAKMRMMNKNKDNEPVSKYRIFSRLACNFVFPVPSVMPNIREGEIYKGRPVPPSVVYPDKAKADAQEEADAEAQEKAQEEEAQEEDEEDTDEEEDDTEGNNWDKALPEKQIVAKASKEDKKQYQDDIKTALNLLKRNGDLFLSKEGLSKYSPKFLKMLGNIQDNENDGCHLVYSQFRSLEGIEIFKLVLEKHGMAEFKLVKTANNQWDIQNFENIKDKSLFVLYTGTETAEEKEQIRNIYNGLWEIVPMEIKEKLEEILEEKGKSAEGRNKYGDVIKVFMITSSGAEGIDLKNTRFVHFMESYWNMVRLEQVIGRAKRICSHKDLPPEKQTVKVFVYQSVFSKLQKEDTKEREKFKEIMITKDRGETTDEFLFEKALVKEKINRAILNAIKETSIDCQLFANKEKTVAGNPLVCFNYGKTRADDQSFSSYPTLIEDEQTKNTYKALALTEITINGKKYAYDEKTKNIYSFESYENVKANTGELVLVGKIEQNEATGKNKAVMF